MFPAATAPGLVAKSAQPTPVQTAQKAAQPQSPETARTSAGEAAAANVRAETTKAIEAAKQSTAAPRLRDQEKNETVDRSDIAKDAPTGPEPTFEESPLERQARVALDPPDLTDVDTVPADISKPEDTEDPVKSEEQASGGSDQERAPPPTPSERAETSFAETREMSEPKEPVRVDIAR